MPDHILAIDQGTTSSRAIVFRDGDCVGMGQEEFPQHFPRNGWVEHDPEDLWRTTLRSCEAALADAGLKAADIAAIGITNQRETTLVWNRETGVPVYPAIVWQDRRTSAWCEDLQRRLDAEGRGSFIRDRTGLLADPYFSASKIRWILDNVPGAAADAGKGKLAFGTVDCFLLWRLTGGARHCTDISNAARTLLFDIDRQCWDAELLDLFGVPASMLPQVLDNAADFGGTRTGLLGAPLPVTGMAGDQQAAAFGQCCFEPGMAKSTYGTGAFLLMNTGERILRSENRLLSTIAYRLAGRTAYALEGSIFMAGATLQWLRDGLGLIEHAAESEALGFETGEDLSVILVPAFTGLGAPWWDPHARGAIFGLTRDTGIREIVTAALQSVCFQTRDLQEAMRADGLGPSALRVDGGMTRNAFLLQNLADLLGCRVDRPAIIQTTALGAACLAGLHCGIYDSLETLAARWRLDASFSPRRDDAWRKARYDAWREAVGRTRSEFPRPLA